MTDMKTSGLKTPQSFIPTPTCLSGSYYFATEAAECLGMSRQRVHVYLKEQRLTGIMFGRRWLIDADSVERLAESLGIPTSIDASTEPDDSAFL